MAADTHSEQPEQVSTEEALRPPDASVVTSDAVATPAADESQVAAQSESSAAPDAKTDGANKSGSAAGDDNESPPSTNKVKKRMGRLTKKVSEQESVIAEKDRVIAEQAQRMADLENQVKSAPKPAEPQLEDFKTPQEYASAYTEWQTATAEPAPKKEPAPAQQQAPTPAPDPAIDEFVAAGIEMLGDEFVEARGESDLAVSKEMADYLFESEVGPAIYVHLANNTDESKDIFKMSAPKAMKALEALEAKAAKGELDIDGQLQIAPAPKMGAHDTGDGGKPESKKPAYTPPSDTRDTGDTGLEPDLEEMGMEAYAARRRKQMKASRN